MTRGYRRSPKKSRRIRAKRKLRSQLAAAVALADDQVSDEENAFINQLAGWFGISAERAAQILDQLEDESGVSVVPLTGSVERASTRRLPTLSRTIRSCVARARPE